MKSADNLFDKYRDAPAHILAPKGSLIVFESYEFFRVGIESNCKQIPIVQANPKSSKKRVNKKNYVHRKERHQEQIRRL